MNFSRSYTFSGKSAIWGAALIFTAAGIIFTFLVPGILAGDAADRIAAGGTVVELAEENFRREKGLDLFFKMAVSITIIGKAVFLTFARSAKFNLNRSY